MSDDKIRHGGVVNTVLGPVAAQELGAVAVHESLLSVLPGAQYAFDIDLDQAQIFEVLATKLRAFAEAGGGTIVDVTGMFHGRDLPLLEALARATGIHIVASTGLGPEENLGGYFLTPQTNPPTPWPADKFADLIALEVTDGMVVPRLERRARAGLIVFESDQSGITPTEISLLQGSARAAKRTGVSLSLRWGADALAELDHALGEGLPAERIVIAGVDRADAGASEVAHKAALLGSFVAIDHVGQSSPNVITDDARVTLVRELIAAGHTDRILLSSGAIGFGAGIDPIAVPFDGVLTSFAPKLREAGVAEADVTRMLVDNPRTLLTVHSGTDA